MTELTNTQGRFKTFLFLSAQLDQCLCRERLKRFIQTIKDLNDAFNMTW